jgi:hypothetical protein
VCLLAFLPGATFLAFFNNSQLERNGKSLAELPIMSIKNPTLSAAGDLAHFRHFSCFSSLFTILPSTTVENVRQITPFYAKQTQFWKWQNEHKHRYNKHLHDFLLLTGAKKQTQFKANKAKNKPNSNPIQTQTNPIQTQSKPICSPFSIFSWTAAVKRLKYNQRYTRGKNMTPIRNNLAAVVITLAAAIICRAEFQINTNTTNKQENPAIAMDGAGNFVVVWNSYLQDKSSNGIFAQRFDPNCSPLGEEIQINTTSTGNQKEPSVAMNTVGNFIVVWQGPGTAEADKEDIFARRFDSNGRPLGSEFRVNTNTNDKQLCPRAAMNNTGGFVIVWESVNVPQEGKKAICSQLYESNGLRIGTEFVANDGPSDGRYPDAAMDAEGNFAVVWMQDKSSNSIMGRLYNADGSAKAEPFEVSSIRFSSVTQPSISMSRQGEFVVVWDGDPELAGLDDIHARMFDANGTAISEQFIVNTTIEGSQQNPKVAINSRRQFIVVWDTKIDPDINEREIFAQRYDSTGETIGDEFQVNTYTEADQKRPAVAMGEGRNFITTWQSYGQDGSSDGVFGRTGQMVGSADFNGDGLVNFSDYCILADEWFEIGEPLTADLIEDNKINERDIAEFCYQWLTTGY